MKSTFSVMLLAAVVAVPAMGATNWGAQAGSTADLTGAPAVRSNPSNVNYQKYETRSTTRTYSNAGGQNYGTVQYTAQPSTRSQMYRTYNSGTATRTATTARTETVRSTMKRKYYLAHPFFQPTEGKFGAITDLSYNTASYDIDFIPNGTMSDTDAKWEMRQFAIKEDLSYGITDRLGVLLMGRYDFSKYKFDWSTAPDDKMDDDGLNIFGAGLQWRFVDNEKWIATVSGYYERQKDIANEFVLDLKGGYKVSKSTIYGLARGWLVNFDDKMYGNGITGKNESGVVESLFISYDDDAKTTFFIEGGLGVFSVLEEDWTLNLEAIFGHYDWHNQASIKGAIGWQPNDWFALELYAKTSFYDTAEGKKLDFYGTEGGVWDAMGKAKLDKYNETSFGGRIMFYF
ncbi:MAG: hypothetical protein IJQ90_01925 [Alphaproteobacteria bacterium]|nr:hypothetical protein [Alphaproteobacteria bacterium]